MTVLLLSVVVAFAEAPLDEALRTTLSDLSNDAAWRSPHVAERTALRDALTTLATAAASCNPEQIEAAAGPLAAADFALERIEVEGTVVLLVREAVEKRGAGMVAVRCGSARPWVWQAPHAFYDLSTGDVARRLFLDSGARAAMWNTVHRYRAVPGEERSDPVHPADVTREHGSLFHAATVGLAAGDPELRFVQVHGFADRDDFDWQAVLSSGDADRPPIDLAKALGAVLGPVAAYGADTDSLGGTVNVQGHTLPDGRFLHLELSRAARQQLRDDPVARDAVVAALDGVAW